MTQKNDDYAVFTDEDEVVDSLRENAERLGLDPDRVAPKEGQIGYFARRSCNDCYGRGVLNIVLSPQKQKTFRVNQRPRMKFTKRKPGARRGPTPPRTKRILGVSQAYESEWNTREPEPLSYKRDNMTQAFCGCVRAQEI